jgi:hypothetical protein
MSSSRDLLSSGQMYQSISSHFHDQIRGKMGSTGIVRSRTMEKAEKQVEEIEDML